VKARIVSYGIRCLIHTYVQSNRIFSEGPGYACSKLAQGILYNSSLQSAPANIEDNVGLNAASFQNAKEKI
jgi:hypothetical protein